MDVELQEQILQILEANPELCDFVGQLPEEKVLESETRLGLTFPEEYRWFCQQFGSGSFGSQEFYGIVRGEPTGAPSVVHANEGARPFGLPTDVILIVTEDEWDCALDVSRGDGTYPVIEWIVGLPTEDQNRTVIASGFLSFLWQTINMVLSWEDEAGKSE